MLKRIRMWCVESYKLAKVFFQIIYGMWRISKLAKPIVTIFGGARVVPNSLFAQKAAELAHHFGHYNISVLTGGGSGIMYAANCGAVPHQKGVCRPPPPRTK